MHILCDHYGDQINNVYQGDSTPAEAIISMLEQEVEFQFFFFFVFLMKLSKN